MVGRRRLGRPRPVPLAPLRSSGRARALLERPHRPLANLLIDRGLSGHLEQLVAEVGRVHGAIHGRTRCTGTAVCRTSTSKSSSTCSTAARCRSATAPIRQSTSLRTVSPDRRHERYSAPPLRSPPARSATSSPAPGAPGAGAGATHRAPRRALPFALRRRSRPRRPGAGPPHRRPATLCLEGTRPRPMCRSGSRRSA